MRELLQSNPSLGLCQVNLSLVSTNPSVALCLSIVKQNGDSPLYAAVLRRDVNIIRMLLRAGADPHLPCSRSSISPSDLANKLNFWEIIQLFSDACEVAGSTSPSPTLL